MNRRSLLLASAALLLPAPRRAVAAEKLPVVASFSILADMVRQVGGERVSVTALVGPGTDAHAYQPRPADAAAVGAAKLLVVNGLGFEGWASRLQQSAAFKGVLVVASKGVKARAAEEGGHAHGGHGHGKEAADPHAWQNVANARLYAANIRDGLVAADPDGKAAYESGFARYDAALAALDAEVKETLGRIPAERRKIITSHDAFGYLGAAYGLRLLAPRGVASDSDPSAADVARIIRQIKAEKVPAVFIETISDPRLLERIGRESGARIGGTLYSDALSPPDGPAATYTDMIRHNVRTLAAALGS